MLEVPAIEPKHAIRLASPRAEIRGNPRLGIRLQDPISQQLRDLHSERRRNRAPWAPLGRSTLLFLFPFLFLFLFQSAECSAIGGVQTLFSREVADGNGIGSAGVHEGVAEGLAGSSKPAGGTLEGG